jgi:hypothetical protein
MKSDLAPPAIFGDRHSAACLGNVKANENVAILLNGSSSCA